MILKIKCGICSVEHEIETTEQDYNAWRNGELIQNVMPYLNLEQREMLISGTCQECWDNIFGGEDEE